MATERIVLGSGKVYVVESTGTLPTDEVIETEDNLLGYIQNGATVSYTPSFYTAKGDDPAISK